MVITSAENDIPDSYESWLITGGVKKHYEISTAKQILQFLFTQSSWNRDTYLTFFGYFLKAVSCFVSEAYQVQLSGIF